jgi:DNA phosphorothioation-associated putative methyltransferase
MAGKIVRGAHYVHRSAIHLLASRQRILLESAQPSSSLSDWNVVRIESGAVAFLEYEDFDRVEFPALRRSQRINLADCKSSTRDYRSSENPLILHRKELTLDPADSRVEEWSKLTAALVERGLFQELHLIGRRRHWSARLRAAGLQVVEHKLCPV